MGHRPTPSFKWFLKGPYLISPFTQWAACSPHLLLSDSYNTYTKVKVVSPCEVCLLKQGKLISAVTVLYTTGEEPFSTPPHNLHHRFGPVPVEMGWKEIEIKRVRDKSSRSMMQHVHFRFGKFLDILFLELIIIFERLHMLISEQIIW